ncbi:hypothetical protein [Mucilaginibacter sp. PPCGB 2223]|uniref:hypothetical protein n=1 Tax=Mucilaginibacter sp. PPCGB 2223 TaxID=1886027 RepID=UPI0011123B51|nr:hypothetical protein [Mucilaginibacter sp. PPCGB 2223]
MKTTNFLKLPAIVLLLAVGACSKSNNGSTVDASISTDDAANIMANSVSSGSGGMAGASVDVTANAQLTFNANPGCGGTKTYSFNRQSPQGASVTYSYSFNYTYTLNCVNNVPDNVSGNATSTGSYDGPSLTSTDSGTLTFNVGGLAQSSTAYSVNGEYKRTGSFTQKTGNMRKGSSNVDITVTSLSIPKGGSTIASGSATFTLSGTSNNGSFSFNGTITFTGNNQANLVVNGTAYVVNLVNGNCTRS